MKRVHQLANEEGQLMLSNHLNCEWRIDEYITDEEDEEDINEGLNKLFITKRMDTPLLINDDDCYDESDDESSSDEGGMPVLTSRR